MNKFFDHIYCINLDKETDRWGMCQEVFNEMGWDVERVSAINGHELKDEEINWNIGRYNKKDHNIRGAMGCCLSFTKAFEDALKKGYESFAVLEDDFYIRYPKEEFETKLDKLMGDLPSDWEWLYIGGHYLMRYGVKHRVVSDGIIQADKINCCHAMAFKRSILQRIINYVKPCNAPIDSALSEIMKNEPTCYAFYPSLIVQRDSFSSIELEEARHGRWIKYS